MQTSGRLSQAQKTILIVWVPIILLGLVYGGLYLFSYDHAKNEQTAYLNAPAKCIAHEDNSDGSQICYIPNGAGIQHGILGLDKFVSPGFNNN